MTFGLWLYSVLTSLLSPFLGLLLAHRTRKGKERKERRHERFARTLPDRPKGTLIWLHGASVGESLVLLEVASELAKRTPKAAFLFTCQTLTAADRITADLSKRDAFQDRWAVECMAPIDSPAIAKRFIKHWHPDLVLIAEGDVWPNLLRAAKKSSAKLALVNARMTDKSIAGWARWPGTAKKLFGAFDLLLASDQRSYRGLRYLSGQQVYQIGNLKSALPAPAVKNDDLHQLQAIIGKRSVLLAASTHKGEEAIAINAFQKMSPRPFLILAPRHPERGDWIESLLSAAGLTYTRRSTDETPLPETEVLLADTMGEMGLWYTLAETVYLGGGHAPGVGGHNPMEALLLGKPVMTGPSVFNFSDMMAQLIDQGLVTVVEDVNDIVEHFPLPAPKPESITSLKAAAFDPMAKTLTALEPLLPTPLERP